ncbi:MAG TPA: RteC domain-containing protein [Chitinophagaceae bacterium]|nr:RteC domain-containing protein [Chitinophagaceae bacterium]
MNQRYEQSYKEMLAEVSKCLRDHLPETEIVAACFWAAKNHWLDLKKEIKQVPFNSEEEEIDFFRNIKPKFTAEIQYYTIVSEALLFVPAKKEDQVLFWEKESERYKWFRDKHKEFIEYFEEDLHHLDGIWFTRVRDVGVLQDLITYDADIDFCSTHDHLLRSLWAHKRYHEYAQNKLKAVKPVSL